VLANEDRQLGRVLDALRSQPVDDYVWMSALIAGPPSLVGNPRRLEAPTSQVDILPTLLDLVRDPEPCVAVGHSLLGEMRADRAVLAVREGGLRVDRGGWSLFIPRAGTPWCDRTGDGRVEPVAPAEGGFTDADIGAWRRRVDRNLIRPRR